MQPQKRYPELELLDKYSAWLDSRFRVPGTNFRFGLDPIVGLVPVAGEIASFLASALLVIAMARHGASGEIAVRMLINITLDSIIGSIPVIGNIFDFFMKPNERNLRLLKEHYQEGKHKGSGKGIVAMVIIVLLAILVGVVYLTWKVAVWAWEQFM